jgi:hypothetical protein
MPKRHVEGCRAIVSPREVVLVVEMAQLHLLLAHVAKKDPVALVIEPAVALKEIQTHVPVEILHLKTQKNPSSST